MFPCGVAVHLFRCWWCRYWTGKLRHADQRFEGEQKSLQCVCCFGFVTQNTSFFSQPQVLKRGWFLRGPPSQRGPHHFLYEPSIACMGQHCPRSAFRKLWRRLGQTPGSAPPIGVWHGCVWICEATFFQRRNTWEKSWKNWVKGFFPQLHLGVSKNNGTPKWMVYNGKHY